MKQEQTGKTQQATYDRRFGKETVFRNKMYSVLCQKFYQGYVKNDKIVLDVAAGYCEFINNIQAKKKYALDINPDITLFADPDVEVITGSCTDLSKIKDNSVDVVFISNLLEHLTKDDILQTLRESRKKLVPGGKILILQPNIKYCYADYWMFFDHITPLDDQSVVEALELTGFKIEECLAQFLPYTTKGKLPKSIFLLKIYLMFPFLHDIFGKQAFIYAERDLT